MATRRGSRRALRMPEEACQERLDAVNRWLKSVDLDVWDVGNPMSAGGYIFYLPLTYKPTGERVHFQQEQEWRDWCAARGISIAEAAAQGAENVDRERA